MHFMYASAITTCVRAPTHPEDWEIALSEADMKSTFVRPQDLNIFQDRFSEHAQVNCQAYSM